MRPSEKFEAKAAGTKIAAGVAKAASRTILARQRRHRALQPAVIESVT